MRKSRFIKIDYSMLSSYLGRSATVIVFAVIVLLALGALFLDENDMAHMPISIGVCCFDSVRVYSVLESLADLVRERGGGDIRWHYYGTRDRTVGCDFYLMTSLQVSPYMAGGELDCSLIATVKEGCRYARGAVIVKPGPGGLVPGGGKVIFTSMISAAGFLSPYKAMEESGFLGGGDHIDIEFCDDLLAEERVIFGVLFGACRAGGIGLERFRYLERLGVIREGELNIIFEGPPYPEILLASDRNIDPRKLNGFSERLPSILQKMSPSLRIDLADIGITGFIPPREEDLELLRRLSSIVPEDLSL